MSTRSLPRLLLRCLFLLTVLFAGGCSDEQVRALTATDQQAMAGCGIDGLPPDWCVVDVGSNCPSDGDPLHANGVFTIPGCGGGVNPGGEDIDPDAMRFVYKVVAGDVEIKVRLTSMTGNHPERQAGLMLRAYDPTLGNPGAGLVTRVTGYVEEDTGELGAPNKVVVRWRIYPGDPNPREGLGENNTTVITPSHPSQWLRLQRNGNDVSVARSVDGSSPNSTWIPIASASGGAFIGDTALVGFFVSAGRVGDVGAATFDNVTVSTPPNYQYRTSWVGATYARDSTGYSIPQMNSFFVDPNGVSYAYASAGELGHNLSRILSDGTVKTLGAASGGKQGAISGNSQFVYVAGTQMACATLPDPNGICLQQEIDRCYYYNGEMRYREASCAPSASSPCTVCSSVDVLAYNQPNPQELKFLRNIKLTGPAGSPHSAIRLDWRHRRRANAEPDLPVARAAPVRQRSRWAAWLDAGRHRRRRYSGHRPR